jgi:hypothetical protein
VCGAGVEDTLRFGPGRVLIIARAEALDWCRIVRPKSNPEERRAI